MPTIVVDVMPKPELLDPAGKAVARSLQRLGTTENSAGDNGTTTINSVDITNVRIGKRFELTVDGEVTEATLAAVQTLAEDLLSNQVIEDVVSIRLADEA